MACNNSGDDNLLDEFRELTADILSCLDETGMLMRNKRVFLAKKSIMNYDPALLESGTAQEKLTEIKPTPKVLINTKMYIGNEVVQKLGVARIELITRANYTREDLEGADYWVIEDNESSSVYRLIEGGLTELSNGMFWEANLERDKSNLRLST